MNRNPLLFMVSLFSLTFFSSAAHAQWIKSEGFDESISKVVASDSNFFAAGCSYGIYQSSDTGKSWDEIAIYPMYTCTYAVAARGSIVFTGTANLGVYRSADNGKSWMQFNQGLTTKMVVSLAFNGSSIFAGTDKGLFRATAGGQTWAGVMQGLTDSLIFDLTVNGSDIYAGTGHGLFRSTDNGTSWTSVNKDLESHQIEEIAVSNGAFFVSIESGRVLRSIDNGKSFNEVNGLLSGLDDIVFTTNGSKIFAANGSRLFASPDNGSNWYPVESNLDEATIQSLAMSESEIFAGTNRGVWRRPQSQLVGVKDPKPASKRLPFAGFRATLRGSIAAPVEIAFSLPQTEKVCITAYDLHGQKIAAIVNERFEAGQHSIRWDSHNLAAGCYTIRMQAGSYSTSERISMLR